MLGNKSWKYIYYLSFNFERNNWYVILQAIRKWGKVLQTFYGRSVAYRDSDLTNNYIGYWTDNGNNIHKVKNKFINK